MVKESARKCGHCGINGHNSRTCNGNGNGNGGDKGSFRLFGVDIVENKEPITVKKSQSMGDLELLADKHSATDSGYFSDSQINSKKNKERKKGNPWSEEEHRFFLAGLEKMGKGDWIGISKNFVKTRTPTQIASHAQKYFLRLASKDKRKRRTSVFDIALEQSGPKVENSSDGTPETLPQANKGVPVMEAANAGATSTQSANTVGVTQQANNRPSVPMATQFPLFPLIPASAVSNYKRNGGGKILMPLSSPFMSVMNYGIPTRYVQVPQAIWNGGVSLHPSGILAPISAGPAASISTSTRSDPLELTLRGPSRPNSHTSNTHPNDVVSAQ